MIEELDNLTEINLKILFDSSRKEIEITDFKDDKDERLMSRYNGVSVDRLIRYMEKYDLIETFEDTSRITTKGDEIAENGGWLKYRNDLLKIEKIELSHLKEKDNIAFEKSKIDLELAKKMLKEYPKTKWFARFGFFIGIVLAIVQLTQWIMQLLSQ
jgi:hypothetical protein